MTEHDDLMPIGMFSRATLLSVKALRSYHELGLLVPTRIDPGTGYRSYAVSQLPDAEAIRRPGLSELLQREYRITLAGPTTLTALLNSLQMGFRTLAIEQRSSEVWSLLGAVKSEFGKFAGILEKAEKQISTVSTPSARRPVLAAPVARGRSRAGTPTPPRVSSV